jgi:tellurite methyltransferase
MYSLPFATRADLFLRNAGPHAKSQHSRFSSQLKTVRQSIAIDRLDRPRKGFCLIRSEMSMSELRAQFGEIDIYLFDQLLRGRVARGARILDAGCGFGRNLVYLLRHGYEVFGVDQDPRCDDFRLETIESMSFPDAFADLVISSAVLHFARDDGHFRDMLQSTWRVLRPGGLLFCRLASSIGMEHQVVRVAGRRFLLPDGSERYLVDEALLTQATSDLRGRMIDPLKTTVVQNERCMTTWLVWKDG